MSRSTTLCQLDVVLLEPGRFQPRRAFASESLQELANSIRANGILQPIIVRPLSSGRYEIIAGERRWRAAQLAELTEVPCLVGHYSDEQAAEASAVENIIRVDLNPIEEAQAYQRLIDEFDYLHDEIAAAVGRSRVKITNTLRLLSLESAIQKMIIDGVLTAGHGKILASLSVSLQHELAAQCVRGSWSVRKLERAAKKARESVHASDDDDPDVTQLERALSDHLGSSVEIVCQDGQGQLKIAFHDLQILEGLCERFGFQFET